MSTQHLHPTTITPDTRLQLSTLPSSSESGISLDVNQWRILSQVASCPNLRAVATATGIEVTIAADIVADLLRIGLVEIVPPLPAAPQFPLPSQSTYLTGLASTDALSTPAQSAGPGLITLLRRWFRGL